MTLHQMMLVMTGSTLGTTVNLDGQGSISAQDPSATGGWDARAGIRINTDGTIDKYTYNGTTGIYSQIDESSDWIIPKDAASSDYQVWLEVNSGQNPNYASDSKDTWLPMSANRQWIYRRSTQGGPDSFNWTLKIRFDGGADIDSGVYSGTVECNIP